VADNLRQAITTTIADPDITDGLNATDALPAAAEMADPGSSKFWGEVYDIMGVSTYSGLQGKIKLEPTGVKISYSVGSDKNVQIHVEYDTDTNEKYNFWVE